MDTLFSQRKEDHIRLSLDERTCAGELSGFDRVELLHEALPEINLSELSIGTRVFGVELGAPIFISSMTAGHEGAQKWNWLLAEAAEQKNWLLAVGSQRRELFDASYQNEWKEMQSRFPRLIVAGNVGLSQVIQEKPESIQRLVDNLGARALFVHTNPLQEALQLEGTPDFKGGILALQNLAKRLSVPLILKEVGTGMRAATLRRLKNSGLFAVDLAGAGGTHWGRIEALRIPASHTVKVQAARSFFDWGLSTVDCLADCEDLIAQNEIDFQIWASGGVRSGVDVTKCLVMGARMVGVAQIFLKAAQDGVESLISKMEQFEQELRCSMFCLGAERIEQLTTERRWRWRKI